MCAELFPDHLEGHLACGFYLRQMKQWKPAVAAYMRGLQIHMHDSELLTGLEECREEQAQCNEGGDSNTEEESGNVNKRPSVERSVSNCMDFVMELDDDDEGDSDSVDSHDDAGQ